MKRIRYSLPVIVCIIIITVLLFLPTGFEEALVYKGADRCAALVTAVDNEHIIDTGLIRSGEQRCTVEFLGGKFKGQSAEGYNLLNGSLESDKLFSVGDKAMVVINYVQNEITSVT